MSIKDIQIEKVFMAMGLVVIVLYLSTLYYAKFVDQGEWCNQFTMDESITNLRTWTCK